MSQPRNNKKRETNQKGRVKIKDGGQILNTRTWRKQREMRVLAERNPAVVPVGVWVESGDDEQEHPAVRASLTEELLEETRRTKEESLRQFQDAVRRRVSEQARIRKQQHLQKAYKIVERECREFPQSGDVVQCLTPQKSRFPPWPQGELAVGSPNARWVKAQELKLASSDDANQYRHQLSRIMKQVRHRLAACQTVRESKEFSELPGGIWKVSPTRDKTVRRITEDDDEDEEQEDGNEDGLGDEEEVLLVGQHDRPLCLQNGKTVTFQNDAVRERVLRETHPTSLDCRSTQALWPREDQEEQKRERRSQVLTCRRLFMDVERQQAKEHERRKKHLRRIARIKSEKEQQREEEERRMKLARQQEERQRELAEREHLVLERLRLEEVEQQQEEERRAKAKKSKESTRYVEALRAQIKEKLEQEKVELPPLCSCGGESFWDSHPDTCANNCIFYNNPKAYAQALHSVLLSCEPCEGGAGPGGLTRKIVRTLAHHGSNFI
ncbi:coiled-coil domain-containing protein 15 isoform X1 [Tachysurus vachellii]|nr:coiled-coil domain-containing protein 15 isoform X1 [Tachysurus vachellii]